MPGVLEMNPALRGIEGIESHRCFEIPDGRPIVYSLEHGNNHAIGTWYDDYALKNGTVGYSDETTSGTRRMATRDSDYVIVVRTECDKDGVVSKTVTGVYYRPSMSIRVLADLVKNEQS